MTPNHSDLHGIFDSNQKNVGKRLNSDEPLLQDARLYWHWRQNTCTTMRSLAKRAIVYNAPIPPVLKELTTVLLLAENKHRFPKNSIDYCSQKIGKLEIPSSKEIKQFLKDACPQLITTFPLLPTSADIGLATTMEYHHDTTLSDRNAYVVWFLGTSTPMDFVWAGVSVACKPGTVAVFDAQQLHALLLANESCYQETPPENRDSRAVVVVACASLTPLSARAALGIKTGKCGSKGFESRKSANNIKYSGINGTIIFD